VLLGRDKRERASGRREERRKERSTGEGLALAGERVDRGRGEDDEIRSRQKDF
jgi:hypothetical protein